MNFGNIKVKINSTSDTDICEAMLRIWMYHFDCAFSGYNSAKNKIESAYQANKMSRMQYDQQMKDDDSIGLGYMGYGYTPPYSDREIERLKSTAEEMKQQYEYAKVFRDYFVRFVINKAHKND